MTRKKGKGKIMRNKKDGEKRSQKKTKQNNKQFSYQGSTTLKAKTLCPATSQHPSVDYFPITQNAPLSLIL